jgi:uncharacterized protein (DUF433 family)
MYDRIVSTEGVMGGEPRIEGHRISVRQIADLVSEGDTHPDVVADRYGLSRSVVYEAMAYYYENEKEFDQLWTEEYMLQRECDAIRSPEEAAKLDH